MKKNNFLYIFLSILLYSCNNSQEPSTSDEVYTYQSTLERNVIVFSDSGREVPQNLWSADINSWILQHDSLKYNDVGFSEIYMYPIYNILSYSYEYRMSGDTIIFTVDTAMNQLEEAKIGIKKDNSLYMYFTSVYLKTNNSGVSMAEYLTMDNTTDFLNKISQHIKTLSPLDTLAYISSIFQYRRK